jgi:diguanylate cyclase
MVCDIDFFKKINDTYGHKVGDLALKKLASLLQERLRVNDIITRYGGEEFAIILPHTGLEGAQKAAEGIRSYIDKATFSYKGKTIPLTISVGVSKFIKGDDKNSVFERADRALYLAKNSGRNAVRSELDA